MINRLKIGEKVKKRRLELGLTQADVAGSFMTRNMLSLIENGVAAPSLESAEYLASALSVPLPFLFSETDTLFPYEKGEKISYLRDLLRRKNYKHCMSVLDTLSGSDDETNYIYAYSAFMEAKALIFSGSLSSGERYLNIARDKSKETVYDTSYIESNIPLYHAVATNIQSPLLELDTDKYETDAILSEDYEFFKYITMDKAFVYSNSMYEKHLCAKALIKKYNFADAIALLTELLDTNTYPYNFYALFGIYTDLENAYRQIGDFENAYRYSSKRLSLINAFNT